METAQIDDIAYILKQNKKNKLPGAIIFLGAGVSVTAGIPKADDIAKEIIRRFKESPSIKRIPNEQKDYHSLMNCITAVDRKTLLNKYIADAKINVSHIYLSHLVCEGYVDYIVTVNFDNLTLRALSLFNQFPAVYDISILKEITTTTFDIPAVIFMHGQHHGLWQLNTDAEMKKINDTAPHIFRQIANQRPWIIVGYGATDPVFNHIVNLGRFDNNLFWVGYNEFDPPSNVQSKLLNKENSGAKLIKGFDADLFFMGLHSQIITNQPDIFEKPFSHLKKLQESIIDIQDGKFDEIKTRLLITKKWVEKSIGEYELGKEGDSLVTRKKQIERDILEMELIDCLISKKFQNVKELEKKVIRSKNPKKYYEKISSVYNNWGIDLFEKAKSSDTNININELEEAKIKFRKAIDYNPNDFKAYTNLGSCTADHAKIEKGNLSDSLFELAYTNYSKASTLNKKSAVVFYCWGNDLASQAGTKKGLEATRLYNLSYKKYEIAIKYNPHYPAIFYNWGTNLLHHGKKLFGNVASKTFLQACKNFEIAINSNTELEFVNTNWGNTLLELAYLEKGQLRLQYLKMAAEKYKSAIKLNPIYFLPFSNLGVVYKQWAEHTKGSSAIKLYILSIETLIKSIKLNPEFVLNYDRLANSYVRFALIKQINERNILLKKAIHNFKKYFDLTGKCYNLSCSYALIEQKKLALTYLAISIKNSEVKIEDVIIDEDWKFYQNDEQFLKTIGSGK